VKPYWTPEGMKSEKLLDHVFGVAGFGWYHVGEIKGGDYKNYKLSLLISSLPKAIKVFFGGGGQNASLTNPAKAINNNG